MKRDGLTPIEIDEELDALAAKLPEHSAPLRRAAAALRGPEKHDKARVPRASLTGCQAKVTASGSQLYLYGDIGADWFGEGITEQSVKSELERCTGDLSVFINSPGGSVFTGLAIYSQLRRYDGGAVTCYVDGLAASIASVIALAGKRCVMSPASMLMIHEAQGAVIGNSSELRKMADDLEKITETIRGVYAAKTGKSDEDVAAMLAAETWLSADDCVKQGFADAIVEDPAEPDEDDKPRARLVDTYRNTPESLRSVPQAAAIAAAKAVLRAHELLAAKLRRSPAGGSPRPAGSITNGIK